MSASYYDILEVEKNASGEAIKKAYRKKAMKYHPDRNPGDVGAEERFKDVANAYRLVGDAAKRKRFDAGEIAALFSREASTQPAAPGLQ